MRDRLLLFFKPGLLLGLLLFWEVILFAFFGYWIGSARPVWYLPYQPPSYDPQKWILTVGAMTAMFGWTVSALVTVNNSVKQHTINTLLQTRLSPTYMAKADTLSSSFTHPDGSLILVSDDDLTNPDSREKMVALRYVLNYFEFISVGVRHGDLHEGLLKSSLRGMLCKVFWMARVHVDSQRKEAPKVYEHLEWLYGRWKDQNGK